MDTTPQDAQPLPSNLPATPDLKSGDHPVGELMDAAASVVADVSVHTASNDMTSRGVESSTVVDKGGRLAGTISQAGMRREVGGRGHDPETMCVSTQIESGSASCFEDETIDHADDTMRDAQVGELSVLNRDGVVVGTTNRAAIAKNTADHDSSAPPAAS